MAPNGGHIIHLKPAARRDMAPAGHTQGLSPDRRLSFYV